MIYILFYKFYISYNCHISNTIKCGYTGSQKFIAKFVFKNFRI